MPEKVKRGLGLVVVAAIALVVLLLARGADGSGAEVVSFLAGVIALVCGLVGLVLIAVGLLRD